MKEVFEVSFSPGNLPYTILLGMVLFYWITVMIGALDISFLDVDLDTDVDADIDADADMETDIDGAEGSLSALDTMLTFMNLRDIPFMIMFSIFSLILWMGALIGNHLFGDNSWLFYLLAFFPNVIGSLLITKVVTTPLRPFFRAFKDTGDARVEMVGQICTMVTDADTKRLGQAEVTLSGAPLRLNVKTWKDRTLKKGDRAIVIEKSENGDYYIVEEFKEWEN